MIWLLACTGTPEVPEQPPVEGRYTGPVALDQVHFDCEGNDTHWRVYSTGVGQAALRVRWSQAVQDSGLDSGDTGSSDTGDGTIEFDETHVLPLVEQDPGAFWALYELTTTWNRGQDRTEVPCAAWEGTDDWSVRLWVDDAEVDCKAGAAGDCGA